MPAWLRAWLNKHFPRHYVRVFCVPVGQERPQLLEDWQLLADAPYGHSSLRSAFMVCTYANNGAGIPVRTEHYIKEW